MPLNSSIIVWLFNKKSKNIVRKITTIYTIFILNPYQKLYNIMFNFFLPLSATYDEPCVKCSSISGGLKNVIYLNLKIVYKIPWL